LGDLVFNPPSLSRVRIDPEAYRKKMADDVKNDGDDFADDVWEEVEDDESAAADGDSSDDDSSDDDSSDDDSSDDDEKEEVEEVEPDPDHPDAVAALKDLGARLELNKWDSVWRILFYESHDDSVLDQIHSLPCLKEVWLMGTKVTEEGYEKFKERFPDITIYFG
jgi:hypothetical protein